MNDADELIDRYPAVRDVVDACRRLLTSSFPGSTETVDAKAGVIGYSYGPGYENMVATLILGRHSVKIGIPFSAAFDDPSGLLAGTGKVHKHIAVESADDLTRTGVSRLLAASHGAWQRRTANSAERVRRGPRPARR